MFPFWNNVIAPLVEAAGARRIVEIGALRGQTTVKLLNDLGPEAELHVIDPKPMFDPSEHERRFPGRYHFHRDTSHDVLPNLPPADAALIDGDHNWYTVYNELKMLASAAHEAHVPLPLLIMHDVGWPYGKRDLYYAPERIPEEFRQPYAQRGMSRSRRKLLDEGGINATMNNALEEGGPRNGVMTALEDFLTEHDRPVRRVILPFYFGLAIVAEEDRLAERPELVQGFERLRKPGFLREMLVLSESLRIRELHWGQAVFYTSRSRLQRTARRYLDLLKDGLTDDRASLDQLEGCLETIRVEEVAGDVMDCGPRDEGGPVLMRGYFEIHDMDEPMVVVAAAHDSGADAVRGALGRFDLLDDRVILDGRPPAAEKLALIRVGARADAGEVLTAHYDRLTLGGLVIVDEYNDPQRRDAVDDFRALRSIGEPLERLDSGGVRWRRFG